MKKFFSDKNKIVLSLIVVIAFLSLNLSLTAIFISNTSHEIEQETEIESIAIKNPCMADGKSNLEWIACEKDFLVMIKKEKERYFDKLMNLFTNNSEKMLANDSELLKEFTDWYENSNNANHTRCLAEMYYTRAGSAYEGNMTRCQSSEAQRDIELLNKNFDFLFDSYDYE